MEKKKYTRKMRKKDRLVSDNQIIYFSQPNINLTQPIFLKKPSKWLIQLTKGMLASNKLVFQWYVNIEQFSWIKKKTDFEKLR